MGVAIIEIFESLTDRSSVGGRLKELDQLPRGKLERRVIFVSEGDIAKLDSSARRLCEDFSRLFAAYSLSSLIASAALFSASSTWFKAA